MIRNGLSAPDTKTIAPASLCRPPTCPPSTRSFRPFRRAQGRHAQGLRQHKPTPDQTGPSTALRTGRFVPEQAIRGNYTICTESCPLPIFDFRNSAGMGPMGACEAASGQQKNPCNPVIPESHSLLFRTTKSKRRRAAALHSGCAAGRQDAPYGTMAILSDGRRLTKKYRSASGMCSNSWGSCGWSVHTPLMRRLR